MSERTSACPENLRSPKRVRTCPQFEHHQPDTSDDHNLRLNWRPAAPEIERKLSPVEAHSSKDLEEREQNSLTASVPCSPPQGSTRSNDEQSVQISPTLQGLPEAPTEDNEGAKLLPAASPTIQNGTVDPICDEFDQIVSQHPSLRGKDSSEAITASDVDGVIAQNEKMSSATSSTEDSDSIYEHLDEFDAEELASILGDASGQIPSEDSAVALPASLLPENVSLERDPGLWSPPLETLRPPNPYHKGEILMIQKHKACPPFGPDYANYSDLRQGVKERDLRTKTLVEICLENPPMEGETAVDDPPLALHILDDIRVKEDGGAQLVVCRLDGETAEYAAKIYDPLYYGFTDRMWSDMPRDVATEADKDYCREVAAYLELDEQFGGKEVPKYHGSWTFSLRIDLPDGQRSRDVRMILMELIQGRTMSDMHPPPYPEEVRLEVLAQTLEAFNRIHAAGIIHRDIAQRNVMICDGNSTATIHRVVIVDFNFAVVSRLAEWRRRRRPQNLPEKPRNPIDDWWDCGNLYDEFGDWLPASWDRLYRPLQQWLYKRWGNSDKFLPHKEPLIWEDTED